MPVFGQAHWGSTVGLLLLQRFSVGLLVDVVVVSSALTSLSTIFQSYHDGGWLRQGAQCSLLSFCLTVVSCPRHLA